LIVDLVGINGSKCGRIDGLLKLSSISGSLRIVEGDSSGSVTDIYLPRWFASRLPAIHVPLILAAVLLHWRNWRSLTVRNSQRRLLLGR